MYHGEVKLTVHAPTITGNRITARYSDSSQEFLHEFVAPHELPSDPAVTKLVQWLALSHSTYLFSLEYFTEVEAEFPLSLEEIRFFEKIFFDGMAEFRYVNSIALTTETKVSPAFITRQTRLETTLHTQGALLLNGGGKDGLTAGLLLKEVGIPFDLFQIGTGVAQRLTSSVLKSDVAIFRRYMDPIRNEGKYQGHRPTSANIAISASLTALITGKRDVIASNENSANEPNLEIDGVSINHQFTKAFEFESEFSNLLELSGIPVRYFSIMRPFHELQIAKLLTKYPQTAQFISCNHGFRKGVWCGDCAKCAFIILMFTALNPAIVEQLFGTSDVIRKPKIINHINELVHPDLVKPLECVGTLEESQIAAYLLVKDRSDLLSPDLKESLFLATRHIDDDRVTLFLTTLNPMHAIPGEYEAAIIAARAQLQNSSHDHLV